MAITNRKIWSEAEQTCFNYLTSELGDSANIKAFAGELPENAYNCWYFEIQGGGEPLDYTFNMETKGGCGEWMMNAQVVGKFTERVDAQYLGATLRTILPTEENELKEVFRFRPRSEPRLERDLVPDRNGKFINVWVVTFELEVIIKEG